MHSLISTTSSIPRMRFLFLLFYTCTFSLASYAQKTLGVTKHLTGHTEKGYVLFAPLGAKTTYLINECGQKVHTWSSTYAPGLSVYLRPDGSLLKTGVDFTDTIYMAAGGKGGIIERFAWDGTLLWRYKLVNDSLCQHHDIYPMANGNVLVVAWHRVSKTEAMSKGRLSNNFGVGQKDLWSEKILELKPVGSNNAQVVWEWSLWDHLIQDANVTMPNYGIVSQHPELMDINYGDNLFLSDWIHMNAVTYNPYLDQIMVSSHNTDEIWIIDHSTTTQQAAGHIGGKSGKGGDFLYRWGNPEAYQNGTSLNKKLFAQHNPQWIPRGYQDSGCIMIFNNGLGRDTAYSTVDIISPPVDVDGNYNNSLPFGPLKTKWSYKDSIPTTFYSAFISGAQRLPNGNTLICSGTQSRFFEIDAKKKVVWEYKNAASATGIQTDGDVHNASGNNVFRCTYYADTFSGLKGKTLTPNGTIELNSLPYSCTIIPPDVTPPKRVTLLPANKTTGVVINTNLKVTFNENIYKGTGGFVTIYQNNLLKEAIDITDNNVVVSGKTMMVFPSSVFDYDARVSISIDSGTIRDSSGNMASRLDSVSWSFNTVKDLSSVHDIQASGVVRVYPNPAQKQVSIRYIYNTPQIELFNYTGQRMICNIKENTGAELILDIGDLSSGVYSLKANGQFVTMIIKE